MSKKQQSFDPVDILNENDTVSEAHLSQQKAVIQITKQALLSSNLNQLSKETLELAKGTLNFDLGEILQIDINQKKLINIASIGWTSDQYGFSPHDLQAWVPG